MITHQINFSSNRYEGTDIQVAARAQDAIQAIGQQGDNVTIAAYYMNDVHEGVVQDDTGRYHLRATLPAPTDGTTLAHQKLVVRSTGLLQENGSQLGLLRVAIHTSEVRQLIGVRMVNSRRAGSRG